MLIKNQAAQYRRLCYQIPKWSDWGFPRQQFLTEIVPALICHRFADQGADHHVVVLLAAVGGAGLGHGRTEAAEPEDAGSCLSQSRDTFQVCRDSYHPDLYRWFSYPEVTPSNPTLVPMQAREQGVCSYS